MAVPLRAGFCEGQGYLVSIPCSCLLRCFKNQWWCLWWNLWCFQIRPGNTTVARGQTSGICIESSIRYWNQVRSDRKELLPVVFTFIKFHRGKDVVVESDHKLLEMIAKKSLAAAPPRLQRMLLRLQQYSFHLQFKPGNEMVLADTLSQAYISDGGDHELERELECAVHLIISTAPITDAKLNQLMQELKKDDSMATLSRTIRNGWPNISITSS